MAYKRPLVLSSTGLIEELQAADLLDQSAVIVGPAFGGSLTAGQVPYANSTTTVLCSANLTFDGNTLTAAALSTGYTQTTGGLSNTLSGLCIPLAGSAASNFMLFDCNDAFAFVDQAGIVTPTPAPNTGGIAQVFRRDPPASGGLVPVWSTGGTTSVVLVVDPQGTISRGNNFNLVLNFVNGYSVPTSIKIEGWDNTLSGYTGGYTIEYNSAVSITGLVWVSPAITALGNLVTLGKFRITLTIPDPAIGTPFSLARVVLTNPATVFDPWCLSRQGGNVYGSVSLVGSGSNLTVGGTLGVTGAATLSNVTTLTMASSGTLTLPSGYAPPSLISTNVNFYVSTTGSDTTGNGSSGNPWATLGHAMTYLAAFHIAPNISVTINLGAGTYTSGSSITVQHPQGSQIIITGATPVTTTLSSVTSFGTPSSGVSAVVLVIASAAGIAVGDYLLITPSTTIGTLSGTNTHWWNILGCHKVTAVSGTSITVNVATNTANAASSYGTLTGLTTLNVTVLTTILAFSGTSGLNLYTAPQNWSIGAIENLVLYGPAIAGTIGINAGAVYLNTVGVVNWSTGYNVSGLGYCLAYYSAFSGCSQTGLQVTFGSSIALTQCVVNGGSYGIYALYGVTAYTVLLATVGCSGIGCYFGYDAVLDATAPISCDNTATGFSTFYCANAIFNKGGGGTFNGICSYNGTASVYTFYNAITNGGSFLTYTGNGNSNAESPAQGTTPGNFGSYNFV
jgi:hypothetical protein